MTIKYRAVHARNSWRKVGNHRSLHSALEGPDGAKALLLKQGRIAQKWDEYGEPSCVLVWEEGEQHGYVLRLNPRRLDEVQTATVPIDQLLNYEAAGGCGESDIAKYFEG